MDAHGDGSSRICVFGAVADQANHPAHVCGIQKDTSRHLDADARGVHARTMGKCHARVRTCAELHNIVVVDRIVYFRRAAASDVDVAASLATLEDDDRSRFQ